MSGNPERHTTVVCNHRASTLTITTHTYRKTLIRMHCSVHGDLHIPSLRVQVGLGLMNPNQCACSYIVQSYFEKDNAHPMPGGIGHPVPLRIRNHNKIVHKPCTLDKAARQFVAARKIFDRLRVDGEVSMQHNVPTIVVALHARKLLKVGRRVFVPSIILRGKIYGAVINQRSGTHQPAQLIRDPCGNVYLQLRASRREWGTLYGESGIREWGVIPTKEQPHETKTNKACSEDPRCGIDRALRDRQASTVLRKRGVR